ncbi:MAG: TIGR03936 family radical SAM-associated protein [Propionibacteriaceae bacterium]|jgi:radical SAM-linked protein|nr:TIGR03936 family radical SAM-associated protein [Propionibacteriaceae bacterium]
MPRPQPPQNPPPVQRLLLKYGKVGPMRFASHRDYARALERGLRRADLPMAYSSGFNPHPRISYINPAPTGAASRAEYVVLGLRETVDPAAAGAALGAVMPKGLPVLALDELVAGADAFTASLWLIQINGVGPDDWRSALMAYDQRLTPQVEVCRMTKNGPRSFDVADRIESMSLWPDASGNGASVAKLVEVDPVDIYGPARQGASPQPAPLQDMAGVDQLVVAASVGINGTKDHDLSSCLTPMLGVDVADQPGLLVIIRHTEPLVRPDDVVQGLRTLTERVGDEPAVSTRLAQGTVSEMLQIVTGEV